MPDDQPTNTDLGTTLTFEVIDMRGTRGFPDDPRGLVYVHREDRELPERYGRAARRQQRTWVVRHGGQEQAWRVDLHSAFSLWEVGVPGTWSSPEEATAALEERLTSQVVWEG